MADVATAAGGKPVLRSFTPHLSPAARGGAGALMVLLGLLLNWLVLAVLGLALVVWAAVSALTAPSRPSRPGRGRGPVSWS